MNRKTTNKGRKLNPKKVCIFALIILIFLLIIISKTSKSPKISLNGASTIDIPLNTNYTDEGASAKYGKKDISGNIQTSNNIDTSKVGKYDITYTVKHKNKTTSTTRTINVVDTEAPVLTLTGESEINIAQDSTYQDLGCSAIDNYDGNITTKISIDTNIDTSELGTYTVNYTVKDSSGNESKITRSVNVVKRGSKNISTKKNSGLPVLMYHFFYDETTGDTGKDANYMEIHDFEEQLKYLTENNYYFPTWDEVKNYVEGKSCLPEHSIVITVDDGDKSFFDLAVPIIEKYDVKVTSFIVTSWIEDKNYLKQFNSGKILFESHSHDMHRSGTNGKGRFLTLSKEEAHSDVTTSQSFIGNSTVFCYPFGHYSDSCVEVLKEAEFNLAFTTKYGRVRPGDKPYELSRIRMSKGDSLKSFISRVS
ncbi:MAG: DUF5011 domain-containing protein [Clostridia bacterium]|nr:DUF5011 domain-containing protein [Clostridia bacterium]